MASSAATIDRRVSIDVGVSNYLVIQTVITGMLWTALAMRHFAPIWLAALASPPALHLVLLIGTRSAAVGLVVFLVVEAWLAVLTAKRSGKARPVIRVGILFATILCVYLLFPSLLAERISSDSGDNGRFDLYEIAWHQAMSNPLLGAGIGGLVDSFAAKGIESNYSHNFILDGIARFGILIGIARAAVFLPRLSTRAGGNLTSVLLSVVVMSLVEPTIDGLLIGGTVMALLQFNDTLSLLSPPQALKP
jgi:O-antigen ligase